ncbi:MAG: hypothetical protein GYA87_09975 [Christensenellaceae bacterium]|nr:hypothetical protein [Christensenellaceae bacterium]
MDIRKPLLGARASKYYCILAKKLTLTPRPEEHNVLYVITQPAVYGIGFQLVYINIKKTTCQQ